MSTLIEPMLKKLFNHKLWVEAVLKKYGFKSFVEIGAAKGELTSYILKNVPLEKYYVVDPWVHYSGIGAGTYEKVSDEQWEKMYLSALKLSSGSVMKIFRVPSLTAARLFSGLEFDCVFIDGDHSYEAMKADIVAWWPLVRKGGVLCGHDYSSRFKNEVVKAVDEIFGSHHSIQPHLCWGFRK